MLVCPGCHVGFSPALPAPPQSPLPMMPQLSSPQLLSPAGSATAPNWLSPSAATTPAGNTVGPTHQEVLATAGVQPPYVCGRMFQMGGCVGTGMRPCLTVPHDACHVVCCITCPHVCPTLHHHQWGTVGNKLMCAVTEVRTSLHTSGGGLVEEQQQQQQQCSDSNNSSVIRSISPDTKINHQCSLNPFLPTTNVANSTAGEVSLNPFLTTTPTITTTPADSTTGPPTTNVPAAPVTKEVVFPSDSSLLRHSPSPVREADSTVCDSRVLLRTRLALEESGWYYGPLSWQQAAAMLSGTAVGTFLMRDSASPQCLYSLSVQTTNGPTSVRIHYSCGRFRLDCTGHSQKHMPEFEGVVPLVEHYVKVMSSQVWVDHEGKTFSPIDIRQPLRRTAPSLQHLCRLALNRHSANISSSRSSNTTTTSISTISSMDNTSSDPLLPPALRSFLKCYPHTV